VKKGSERGEHQVVELSGEKNVSESNRTAAEDCLQAASQRVIGG